MADNKQIVLYCECCGGILNKLNETQYKCSHCGNVKLVETLVSSEVINMFNHANMLRNKGEFDDAYDTFELIAKKDPNNPDSYWGMFLSEYGIMHVQDPSTRKFVPTCNRASTISVFDNENYKTTVSLSNDEQKEYFADKAQELEKIRTKIIELANNESPYDIFICYKRTQNADDGKELYTADAIHARDIYEMLSKCGYKVFFAEKSLQDLAGAEYEPLIYNAINTSSVMLVICSDADLINSPWVKNEWRRFIKQISYDSTKRLIPIMCNGLKASSLPDILRKYQGLEMNANFQEKFLGIISNLVDFSRNNTIQRIEIDQKRPIKKSNIIRNSVQPRKIGENQVNKLIISDENLLNVAFTYLQKDMFNDADREFERLTDNAKLKKIVEFGQYYIKFKRDDCELDKQEFLNVFNACISSANNRISSKIFAWLMKDYENYIEGNAEITKACILYSALMGWENNYHYDIFKIADVFIRRNTTIAKPLLLEVLQYYNNEDVDGYIHLLAEYIDIYLENSDFENSQMLLNKILEVDAGNIKIRWTEFLISMKAIEERFIDVSELLKNVERFTEFLSYVPKKDRDGYIDKMCDVAISSVDDDHIDDAISCFDELIKLYDVDSQKTLIKKLYLMARKLQTKYKFEASEKYYSIIVNENNKEHKAYWGILQCKNCCVYDDDLIDSTTSVGEYAEYDKAVQLAGISDEKALNKYISVKQKQDEQMPLNHQKKQDDAKRKIEQKRSLEQRQRQEKNRKILKSIFLPIGIILAIIGVVAICILCVSNWSVFWTSIVELFRSIWESLLFVVAVGVVVLIITVLISKLAD